MNADRPLVQTAHAEALVCRADAIDNRLGPIPGHAADAIADELRGAAGLLTELATALRDTVAATLGPQGHFPGLGKERSEQILQLLLSLGITTRAHDRVWTIDLPDDLREAAREAGGKTLAEWREQQARGKS